ncbi:MAG: hypothetical protein RMM30_06795 [Armatimonadota bacterium]|nr:hypothetical protein [Armatimonadota bacterium]MDW8156277.1 hypothetical protein [Armatimonadota bacterium]
MEVSIGWDGWIRFGEWNPVTVQVAVDRGVRGWLVVEIPQEFGAQRVRLRFPVDLPDGGRSTWRVAALLSDPRRPVRVSLAAEDGSELVSAHATPLPEGAAASVVGYLGRDPPAPPLEVASGGRRAVVRLREELLPDSAAAYASLDLLVVEELDERKLNAAQRRALQTWVLHGGRVVVSGWLPPGNPVSDWLAVARYVGPISYVSGLASVAPGPVWAMEPLVGSQAVVERSRVVAVWAQRGLGRVFAWATDVQRVPPTSPLWYLALPAAGAREVPSELEVRPRPPLGPAAAGLGAYAVVWLFAVALAGRSRWGWVAVALVVAAAAAGMPVVAEQVRQRAAVLESEWLQVVVDGVPRAYAWGHAWAPYPGDYTYTLPASAAVALSGGLSEADVTFLQDRVLVRAHHRAGERMRLVWEAQEAPVDWPEVVATGGEVHLRGSVAPDGVVFWGRRQASVEKSAEGWVASQWEAAGGRHPALSSLRWVYPEPATIVEDRPVAAFPMGDGRRGWVVVVGQAR